MQLTHLLFLSVFNIVTNLTVFCVCLFYCSKFAAVRFKAVVLLLLTFCLLLLPLWESVIVLVLLYVTLCPF